MILGMSTHAFTLLHVVISLVAIVTGLIVLFGMLGSQRMPGWTALFLATTVLTSVTGFLFPVKGFTPALGVGVVSLVILGIALISLYGKLLAGSWRWIYVAAAIAALWFNVLVLVVQAFMKVASLHALAPNGNEPPFIVAQAVAMLFFLVLGVIAAFKFRPGPALST
ncbi:MAG: hypothetical protein ABSF41_18335 [Pseudolabrys sp.]|jgi:hypothetical protein